MPWPGSAIAPSALRTILNEIEINSRNIIVEFGCGISTLYIAKVLKNTEGHITTIENDAN
jgi:predicted O-methyltransferase YrrM